MCVCVKSKYTHRSFFLLSAFLHFTVYEKVIGGRGKKGSILFLVSFLLFNSRSVLFLFALYRFKLLSWKYIGYWQRTKKVDFAYCEAETQHINKNRKTFPMYKTILLDFSCSWNCFCVWVVFFFHLRRIESGRAKNTDQTMKL